MNLPDRIYAQYRNKPKTVDWLNIARVMSGDLIAASQAVRNSYNIDLATKEQLDVIGRIVVVDRSFTGNIELIAFEFGDEDTECGDDNVVFSELFVDSDEQMADDLYRLVIKAKIVKNNSDGTIESIINSMGFLLPNAQVYRLSDTEDMAFSIEFSGVVTILEQWALLNADLVPKPQGVRFAGFLVSVEYVEFGDEDAEFGDTSAEFVGFIGV